MFGNHTRQPLIIRLVAGFSCLAAAMPPVVAGAQEWESDLATRALLA